MTEPEALERALVAGKAYFTYFIYSNNKFKNLEDFILNKIC